MLDLYDTGSGRGFEWSVNWTEYRAWIGKTDRNKAVFRELYIDCGQQWLQKVTWFVNVRKFNSWFETQTPPSRPCVLLGTAMWKPSCVQMAKEKEGKCGLYMSRYAKEKKYFRLPWKNALCDLSWSCNCTSNGQFFRAVKTLNGPRLYFLRLRSTALLKYLRGLLYIITTKQNTTTNKPPTKPPTKPQQKKRPKNRQLRRLS